MIRRLWLICITPFVFVLMFIVIGLTGAFVSIEDWLEEEW
jgi:hypothetical protein